MSGTAAAGEVMAPEVAAAARDIEQRLHELEVMTGKRVVAINLRETITVSFDGGPNGKTRDVFINAREADFDRWGFERPATKAASPVESPASAPASADRAQAGIESAAGDILTLLQRIDATLAARTPA